MDRGNIDERGMQRVGRKLLDSYVSNDWVAAALHEATQPGDEELTAHRWLKATAAKRLTFAVLYGDVLRKGNLRVLDVGGGLCALTRLLAQQNDYVLVDLMAHEEQSRVERFVGSAPPFRLITEDWYRTSLNRPYDVVISADLFPNVDQRLELFLDRMLPVSREIRLTLTVYNRARFYMTRRLDAEEILCMLAWSGAQTKAVLRRFYDRIVQPNLDLLECDEDSVFTNGRQVCLVTLLGDARDE